MAERKKLYELADPKADGPRKPNRSCRCGRGLRACEIYSHYVDGFCRRCQHSKLCHKGRPRLRKKR